MGFEIEWGETAGKRKDPADTFRSERGSTAFADVAVRAENSTNENGRLTRDYEPDSALAVDSALRDEVVGFGDEHVYVVRQADRYHAPVAARVRSLH